VYQLETDRKWICISG